VSFLGVTYSVVNFEALALPRLLEDGYDIRTIQELGALRREDDDDPHARAEPEWRALSSERDRVSRARPRSTYRSAG
jgi:hypothetical protein